MCLGNTSSALTCLSEEQLSRIENEGGWLAHWLAVAWHGCLHVWLGWQSVCGAWLAVCLGSRLDGCLQQALLIYATWIFKPFASQKSIPFVLPSRPVQQNCPENASKLLKTSKHIVFHAY